MGRLERKLGYVSGDRHRLELLNILSMLRRYIYRGDEPPSVVTVPRTRQQSETCSKFLAQILGTSDLLGK
jgi:hypothetical protein